LWGRSSRPVEITQLNKKIIEATKKNVTVRIVIQPPKTGGIVEAFRPVKNYVRLFSPPFEGFSPPFDDRSVPPPRFARQVIVDRREMLMAIVRKDEGILNVDSTVALWVSNASLTQFLGDLAMFDRIWEASEQIN